MPVGAAGPVVVAADTELADPVVVAEVVSSVNGTVDVVDAVSSPSPERVFCRLEALVMSADMALPTSWS